LLKAHSKDTEA